MSDFNLKDFIQNTFPVIVAVGLIHPASIVFLPFLIYLVDFLKSRYYSKKEEQFRFNYEIYSICPRYGGSNDVFMALSWKLEKIINKEDPKLSLTYHQSDYSNVRGAIGRKTKKIIPLYEAKRSSNLFLQYEDNTIVVEIQNNDKEEKSTDHKTPYKIILRSNKDNIKQYIEQVLGEYKEWSKKNKHDINYVFSNDNNGSVIVFEKNIKKNFENIYLEPNTKTKLENTIDHWINNEQFYTENGLPYKKGFLFYGLPGCGKTSVSYALSEKYKRPIWKINLKYFSSGCDLKKFAAKIPSKSIVVFDDIDTVPVTHQRKPEDEDDENLSDALKKMANSTIEKGIDISELFDLLDGNEYFHGCIIIFTTNRPNLLDSTLCRSGRIDHHIEFNPADKQLVQVILNHFFPDKLEDIVKLCNDLPDNFTITQSELIHTHILPNLENPEGLLKNLLLLNKKDE